MNKIYITGGAGFIGSNLVRFLNGFGIIPVVVDKLHQFNWSNLAGLKYRFHDRREELYPSNKSILIHLGANVDTNEPLNDNLYENNVTKCFDLFRDFDKVIYASSAAVYGSEEQNFTERTAGLKPRNAYGFTKWYLDNYIFGLNRTEYKNVFGLRFFNVYGPNETHKGQMQSVVSKAIHRNSEIYDDHGYWLFKSERLSIRNGEQKRDFVFVDDVCKVIKFFIDNTPVNGIYNVGSGTSRTFNDLIHIIDPEAKINYKSMTVDTARSYQYFTQADLTKLRAAGYNENFTSLEDGIAATKKLYENA